MWAMFGTARADIAFIIIPRHSQVAKGEVEKCVLKDVNYTS